MGSEYIFIWWPSHAVFNPVRLQGVLFMRCLLACAHGALSWEHPLIHAKIQSANRQSLHDTIIGVSQENRNLCQQSLWGICNPHILIPINHGLNYSCWPRSSLYGRSLPTCNGYFQQDSAPCHKTRVANWFHISDSEFSELQSPDVSPAHHLWDVVDEMMWCGHVDMEQNLTGNVPTSWVYRIVWLQIQIVMCTISCVIVFRGIPGHFGKYSFCVLCCWGDHQLNLFVFKMCLA